MKCPYCNKLRCVPEVVYINIESYGDSAINFKCVHCDKVIHGYGERKAIISDLSKTDNESDW